MFRGLFIGVDRYRAPINRLSCARADAVALGSLFEDSLDGTVDILLDEEATRANIEAALDAFQQAAPEDLVVISFSGHGTDDHRLVPVDADAADLEASCMSLDDVAARLDRVPARQMIVVLDCCFSGGFGGARVFAPTTTRSALEDRSLITGLVRGDGRVVLTASGAGEPALETQQFGHGLLTYHLIDALQGLEMAAPDGPIPLYELLNHVTTRVIDSARLLNEVQTPTLYGSVEGAPALPRLTPGALYSAAFPSRVRPPVTADWASLEPYGFSEAVINRWATAMPGLNELQQRAINEFGILDGKSLLVVAPTSSGKTLIGELAAVRQAEQGSRAVVLLPLKALVNEKYDQFRQIYGDHLTVVRATGDHADEVGAVYSGQYDLALLTDEKFLNIVTGSPWVMRGVSLVVVDEVQNIGDQGRGPNLEFLLTLVRSGHARGGAPQVIALSAVIGSTNGFERWLNAGLLKTEERPVPLRESIVDTNGRATHLLPDGTNSAENGFAAPAYVSGGQGNKHIVIPLVHRLVSEGKKVIVFRSFKGETVGSAIYLGDALGLAPANSVLQALPGGDLSASSNDLRRALSGGVGFHNADLRPEERTAIEGAFRDPGSDLRIVVATTTLAMGINTPAEAVVIAGLTHYGDEGAFPYSVAEYKNMIGRAGRLGISETGESYIVATGDPAPGEAWNRYVLGQPEPIVSHFLGSSTDPQTMILRSLVVLGGSVGEGELIALLENSFAVWQRIDQGGNGWDRDRLQRDLQALVTGGLIDIEPGGALTVTELGRFAGESGLEVRSVTQVSSLLRFASGGPLTEADLVALAQVTAEVDAVYFPVHGKSRQEQARWPQTAVSYGVRGSLIRGLHVGGGNAVTRAKKAAAVLLFASRNPMANIEATLMQHMRDNSVSGPVRGVANRTRDVIDAVAMICRIRGLPVQDEPALDTLGVRLEIGLPPELGPLATIVGGQLSRANYLDLLQAGLVTPEAILDVSEETLDGVVSPATAMLLRATLESSQ